MTQLPPVVPPSGPPTQNGPVAMPTPPAAAPQPLPVVNAVEQQLADLLTHAGKPGVQTSEFWALVIAPVVTFLVALVAAHVVALGLAAPPLVGSVAPLITATITGALATLAARAYAAARAALKQTIVRSVPPSPLP